MGWDIFKGDLHYTYTRWLLKTFNRSEYEFLQSLRDDVDVLLDTSNSWIVENYDLLLSLKDSSEWYEYCKDSEFVLLLLQLIDEVENNLEYITNFYNSGQRVAYNHLSKEAVFRESDVMALDDLNSYVSGVAKDIKSDYKDNILYTIGEHIDNGTLSDCSMDLINKKYQPYNSRISTDTRCIFTAKTEYARAVNTGLLQAYANYGVDSFDWVTSGLPNTCKYCRNIEANNPYTLDEILSMGCPFHVNCACSVKARIPNNIHINNNPRIINLTPKKNME